ncbi:B3/4 domain-containing protein [Streptomyces sp. NRRL S-1824]|uniref:B3/B4 domain-containing protein n=1 Tax=Streptomyces sp. NRRL S-1824 TaxID=1463889 RepID=UPI0004C7B61B|nr:phenylalanine--tRNA ligase beta subunit-related protein [Streptomyces sp. NRRL S-1824]
MTVFRIAPAVADAFPATRIAVVTATGLHGHGSWPSTTTALQDLEQQLADGTWQPAGETDPRIEAWHTAYRSFGTNPRRIRPSVDALGRRFTKKGTLPRINPAVDSYNAVSVQHGLPAGAFDLDHVTGDVDIRYADGTEDSVSRQGSSRRFRELVQAAVHALWSQRGQRRAGIVSRWTGVRGSGAWRPRRRAGAGSLRTPIRVRRCRW